LNDTKDFVKRHNLAYWYMKIVRPDSKLEEFDETKDPKTVKKSFGEATHYIRDDNAWQERKTVDHKRSKETHSIGVRTRKENQMLFCLEVKNISYIKKDTYKKNNIWFIIIINPSISTNKPKEKKRTSQKGLQMLSISSPKNFSLLLQA